MDLIRASFLLFTAQLRAIVVSKRSLVCALLCLGPVAMAALITYLAELGGKSIPAFELGWIMMVQGTVPLISLIIGAAVIAEEIEDRTITYLFSRPIPRMSVLIGRWVASLLVIEAMLFASAELTFAILERAALGSDEMALPPGMAAAMRNTCLLGGLVYSALFAAVGAFLKHPMIVGIGYTFVVEGFIANLPGQNPTLTIQFHLKSHLAGLGPEFAHRMRNLTEHQELLPPDEALRTIWIVLGIALAVGCWTLSRKQYVLPS